MITLGVTDFTETVPLQVVTRGADSYSTTGDPIKGARNQPVEISGDVQPVPAKTLQDLPEGVRDQVDFAVWTSYDLKTDHVVVYLGQEYRVYRTWERRLDGFTKAVIGVLHDEQ